MNIVPIDNTLMSLRKMKRKNILGNIRKSYCFLNKFLLLFNWTKKVVVVRLTIGVPKWELVRSPE